jgi:exo-beta-1,3-glucanase (GH17 family)
MKNIRNAVAAWRIALTLVLGSLLASCGGGGSVPFTGVTIRPLSEDFIARKAVAYSPYRTATNEADRPNEVITKANIREDLDLVLAAGFRAIRLFDSSDKVARQTLEVIRDDKLNIKVQLGAYVLSGNDAESRAEIERCVTLANEFPDIVLAVSVGNETMVSWAFNRIAPALMAEYIRTVRAQIKQPVTTDDNYAFWASATALITNEIDFAALHTYPNLDTVFDPTLWNWKQQDVDEAERAVAMMDAAIAEARRQYQLARDHLDSMGLSYIPIIIGETGWNAVNLGRQQFRAHPVNQKMYLDRLEAWAAEGRAGNGPKQIFYFEAFDEAWKLGDDGWGLFNKNRQARYAVQAIQPNNSAAGTATWVYAAGSCSPTNAQYFVPPVVNPAITADAYVLYSDAPPNGSELWPTGLQWDAFDGNTAQRNPKSPYFAPNDAPNGFAITPTPASYGWGLLLHPGGSGQKDPCSLEPIPENGATANLSEYKTSGRLNFWISTTYAGKIEIGISTDNPDREPQEAFLQLAPGDFGYCSTGAWCYVSIPLSAFAAANPKIDLSLVQSRFIVSDVYPRTGNTPGSTTPLTLDRIFWSR